MPISAADIQNVAAVTDDFGFEMRVGNVIRSIPVVSVNHGGSYDDPVTQKPRQFDYRCSIRKGNAFLTLAVEAKNLDPSLPLVVCGTQRRVEESFHHLVLSVGPGTVNARIGKPVVAGPGSEVIRTKAGSSFYPQGEFVGKSSFKISKNKKGDLEAGSDGDVYDRWAQALSSANQLVHNAHDTALPGKNHYSAILPVLVVADGSLWRLNYSETGAPASPPEQINQCEFYVGRILLRKLSAVPFAFSHIHFFTLSGFGTFLNEMVEGEKLWSKLFSSDLATFSIPK